MKVILLSDLRHCGRRGEVVEVKPGYARNYLFPQGLALVATEGNLKRFQQERKKIDLRHDQERAAAAEVAAGLAGVRLSLAKRATEANTLYGSVTAAEIVEALEGRGFKIDRRRVDLAGGIKSVGDHVVRIELHPDVIAEVNVSVVAEA